MVRASSLKEPGEWEKPHIVDEPSAFDGHQAKFPPHPSTDCSETLVMQSIFLLSLVVALPPSMLFAHVSISWCKLVRHGKREEKKYIDEVVKEATMDLGATAN